MHVQGDAGVAFDKAFNHARQRVAGLSVGSRNVQGALVWPGMLTRHRLDRIHLR